jgi:PEP-CTERM motif
MKFGVGRVILLTFALSSTVPAFGSGISFTCDATIGADFNPGGSSTAVCNYLNTTVAGLYNSTFTNANASIYIEATNQGLGQSTPGFLNLVSYNTYQTALQTESTDAAKAFVPASEPSIFGSDEVELTSALASALGISTVAGGGPVLGTTAAGAACAPGSAGCYNGIIFINDPGDLSMQTGGQGYTYESLGGSTNGSTENYDFFAVVEHELDEVLGSASCIDLGNSGTTNGCGGAASAVDLFRYSSSGVRAFSSQTPTDQYFSADGGVTDLDGNLYNTTTPNEDWADFSQGCQFIQDSEACLSSDPTTNSYSILTDGPGGTVGPEVAIENAVGYDLKTSTATPEPATIVLFGAGLAAIGFVRRRRA